MQGLSHPSALAGTATSNGRQGSVTKRVPDGPAQSPLRSIDSVVATTPEGLPPRGTEPGETSRKLLAPKLHRGLRFAATHVNTKLVQLFLEGS
jgi:hypothetical protein